MKLTELIAVNCVCVCFGVGECEFGKMTSKSDFKCVCSLAEAFNNSEMCVCARNTHTQTRKTDFFLLSLLQH